VKETEEKYKEEENEPEASRYEKKYMKKLELKCEGEWFRILHYH
jgi:hypothetical protein